MRIKLAALSLVLLLASVLTVYAGEDMVKARGLWAVDGDTIMVELADGSRKEVRFISVNAPELAACLGDEAQTACDALIKGKIIWLELDPEQGMDRRDRNGRLLAHVFLEPVQTPSAHLGTRLAELGLSRLDIRDPKDTWHEDHFDIHYVPWVLAAQIEAAKERRGWWGECDPYRDSDLVIAAIKQWGDDEVVYMVNRGVDAIDLAKGWKLASDPKESQTLEFSRYVEALVLPPGWVLRVHSGPVSTSRVGEYSIRDTEKVIDWYWTGRKMWRNDSDEAWLIWNDQTRYYFSYPLKEWD
ncbi:thermonuclease family protein [Candidatus Bipolaricaulota bacterium]|nr:thermonuclease family protein [Candidatus Bipolaricaulota bacterium]